MFKETKDGLIMRVRVVPNSSKNEIIKMEDDTTKVKITSPPIDGKANKCLIEFLSKTFAVPKTHIKVIKGETSKDKTILITGNLNLSEYPPS